MPKPHDLADTLRILLNASPAQAESAQHEARKVLAAYDREHYDYSDMLKNMPLVQALWWFIDNVSEDDIGRNAYFFLLRERVRKER